jgi:hypothetical protein
MTIASGAVARTRKRTGGATIDPRVDGWPDAGARTTITRRVGEPSPLQCYPPGFQVFHAVQELVFQAA